MYIGLLVHIATPPCIATSGRSFILRPSVPLSFPRTSGRSPDFAIKDIITDSLSGAMLNISVSSEAFDTRSFCKVGFRQDEVLETCS